MKTMTATELIGSSSEAQMAWIEKHLPNWYGDVHYFGCIFGEPTFEGDEPSEEIVGILYIPIDKKEVLAIFTGYVLGQAGCDYDLLAIYESEAAALVRLESIEGFVQDG